MARRGPETNSPSGAGAAAAPPPAPPPPRRGGPKPVGGWSRGRGVCDRLRDGNNARYLWKRIPAAIKSASAELGAIWSVEQRIWQRDLPGISTTIGAHQWSETTQPIVEALRGALEEGWQTDFSTRMVMPKKPGVLEASLNRPIPLSEPPLVPPIPNEQQLARLTDYVAFLEN